MLDVEVPGEHVRTLTCASQLIQELNFSKLAYDRKRLSHNKTQSATTDDNLTDAQKQQKALEQAKKDAEEERLQRDDITGQVYVKAEWKGNGPIMPPVKSENLFKKPKKGKNRRDYTQQEETLMLLKQLYIDVNDPRNEQIITILREQKNEFLVKLFKEDSKNLLSVL